MLLIRLNIIISHSHGTFIGQKFKFCEVYGQLGNSTASVRLEAQFLLQNLWRFLFGFERPKMMGMKSFEGHV